MVAAGSSAFQSCIPPSNQPRPADAVTQPTVTRFVPLRLGARGFSASFNLRANSVENPFDLEMFSGFTCPRGF